MIPASLYHSFYLIVVTIMTLFAMSFYGHWGKLVTTKRTPLVVAILLLIYMIFFIGDRPLSPVFVDMIAYNVNYEFIYGDFFLFNMDTENIIWDNFFAWMACNTYTFTTWVFIIAVAYFGLIFWACNIIFGKDLLLAFVMCLAAFSTFSYSVNGMKAGVAASLFLVAIAYKDKLWISIPIALLTYGFHHSMVMVIAAYFIVLIFKNPKYYILGWILCVIIATLHISFFQVLFARFADERAEGYLTASNELEGYLTGFRLDFILYSAVPIYLGYLMIYKYKVQSTTYSFLLRLYIMTNSIWMLCMYASFSNRIAYLSWFMYPIVLLYPFISRKKNELQGRYLRYVVYGHLFFTLFMKFVYYA